MSKRFTMDNPNDWGFSITDNTTGKVYSCASNILMKDLCKVVNKIAEENEHLMERCKTLQKSINDFIKVEEENEQLKKEYREIEIKVGKLKGEIGELFCENEQLKQQIKDMSRFEHTGEHIRLSINIETGELQRHIYATGQWFGDFDRVLVTNWLDEKTYQKFIDRVIEVYNTEFKGDLE